MAGYHLREIAKGDLGELSKIKEEYEELCDASAQACRIMELHELSDMIGAIEAYLARHHPSYTLSDLKVMAAITKRAFQSGERK